MDRLTPTMVRRMVMDGDVEADWAAAWLDGHSCGALEQRMYQKGMRRIQGVVVWSIAVFAIVMWLR